MRLKASWCEYLEAQWSSAERSNAENSLEDDRLEDDRLEDDRLRLIFTCCHPSLAPEARVALTLREVCGLTTEEIAKAFLTTPRTLAAADLCAPRQRFERNGFPTRCRRRRNCRSGLDAVLQVIYLVFNEGYSAAAGAEVTRAELTGEAIRLGRLLIELHKTELGPEPEVLFSGNHGAEVTGLLALMLLQESPSRRENLSDRRADFCLENQDRSLWNREQIAEGVHCWRTP